MLDRELLELAAKAAGIEIEWVSPFVAIGDFVQFPHNKETGDRYDPLTDDGDALRLAVKLGFLVEVNYGEANQKVIVWDYTEAERRTYEYWGDTTSAISNDPYSATRRAIVRAAAEIGKAMEKVK